MDEALLKIVNEGYELVDCIDREALNAYTRYYSVEALEEMPDERWQQVRHLYMMWDSYWDSTNLETGGYISNDGAWLLAYGIHEETAQGMVQRCGYKLELLDIRNGEGFSVNLSHITGLRTLRVNTNRGLMGYNLTGIPELTHLEELSLGHCHMAERLDLSQMTGLKKLLLTSIDLSNATGIDELHCLEYLRLWSVNRENVLDLSAYPKLRSLSIVCYKVDTVSGLSELRELENLTLFGPGWGDNWICPP